jgi:hypothetical protein
MAIIRLDHAEGVQVEFIRTTNLGYMLVQSLGLKIEYETPEARIHKPSSAEQLLNTIEAAQQVFAGSKPMDGDAYDLLSELANKQALTESKIPGML